MSITSAYLNNTILLQDWAFALKDKAEQLGATVASAGDVNGDGYDDVVVGAPYYESVTYKGGAIFAFYGAQSGLNASGESWSVGGAQQGALFGTAVSSAGDVNGDGYDDVIVGAYRYKDGATPEVGRVDVFYGSTGGLSLLPDWTFIGDQKEAQLGFAVSAAGDVNNDGYDDVIIGARWYDEEKTGEGAVFAFYGSVDGLAEVPDWTATGQQTGAGFGSALSAVGDVNGDGFDDVLIGAPYFNKDFDDAGAAFIFLGSEQGLAQVADWAVYGGQAASEFGIAVGGGGDVNGDGYPDVIIGAPRYDNGVIDSGAAFLFLGDAGGINESVHRVMEITQGGTQLGVVVDSVGDLNGDGFDDVIVGSPLYSSHSQSKEGAAFVWLGSRMGTGGMWSWMGLGSKSETAYGTAVAGVGDVNADGYSDIVVGAPLYKFNRDPCGQVFGYHGQAYTFALPTIYLPLVLTNMN